MADGSLSRFLTKGNNHQLWQRLGLVLAGINGAMAVMGLALGYHGAVINADWVLMDITIAAQFQMIHALAILALAALAREFSCACVGMIMLIFMLGIIGFSGGLYAVGFWHEAWGAKIAPYGGVAFIIGWLWLGALGFKQMR